MWSAHETMPCFPVPNNVEGHQLRRTKQTPSVTHDRWHFSVQYKTRQHPLHTRILW